MKAAIYSPYLNSLGGGERYIMTIAQYLSRKGSVDVFWADETIKRMMQERFDLNLENVAIRPNIFTDASLISRSITLAHYDYFVFLSDGSFPFGTARKNILHFQHPFEFSTKPSLVTQLKLKTWQYVFCNSMFTKSRIDQSFGLSARVLYPPVDTKAFQTSEKQPLILSVGRYVGDHHGKNQHIMIKVFQQLLRDLPKWQLVLIGSVENKSYFGQLQQMAIGANIKVLGDVPFSELKDYYAKASIYWHAQGYGEDQAQYMEHFGISTVEAMAASCIPIVFQGGGQKEIVQENENGLLWQTEEELGEKTLHVVQGQTLQEQLRKRAIETSQQFSVEQFYQNLDARLA